MAEIVNLRVARRRKARIEAAQRADQNRARFGQTKAARQLSDALDAQTRRHLEGHRLEREDAE